MTENESLQERETHRVHFWRSAFPPTGYVGSTEVPADFDGNAAVEANSGSFHGSLKSSFEAQHSLSTCLLQQLVGRSSTF